MKGKPPKILKEWGVMFRPEMVRKILADVKTATRRVEPRWRNCQPGRRLWVRETSCLLLNLDREAPVEPEVVIYRASPELWPPGFDGIENVKWTPSILMRRTRARILLEVVSVTEIPRPAGDPSLLERIIADSSRPDPAVCLAAATRLGVDDAEAYLEGFDSALAFGRAWLSMHGVKHQWPVYRIEFRRIA